MSDGRVAAVALLIGEMVRKVSAGAWVRIVREVWLENPGNDKTTVGAATAFPISQRETAKCA